jgi:AraC-like DNA-binding protein
MPHLGRSAGLAGFVELAREAGLDPFRLAASAGVPRAALTDPDTVVPSSAIGRLIHLAATSGGVDDFGLRMAAERQLANLGPLGLAIRHQATLRGALQVLVDYSWVQNEALAVSLEDLGDITVLRVGSVAWGNPTVMEMTLGILFRAAAALRGPTWRPIEVRFIHRAPRDLAPYRRMFGVTPAFEQDFMGMVMDRADLDAPIPGADPALAAEAARHLAHVAASRGVALRDKVREFILAQMPNGGCSVERVARTLGYDRRTLHRRLAGEGTSFSEVLATARSDLAAVLLANSGRSLHSVAEMLGFASLSAFAHWFRRTFGCTASAYRARQATFNGKAAPA